MRLMARFSLHHAPESGDGGSPAPVHDDLLDRIRRWIDGKGERDGESCDGRVELRSADGRRIAAVHERRSAGVRLTDRFILEEPCGSGLLRTRIEAATDGSVSALACDLEYGRSGFRLSPDDETVRIRCPKLLREVAGSGRPWRYADTTIQATARRVRGRADTERLASHLLDPSRSLPVVAITDVDGQLVDREFPERVQADLSSLANVAYLDDAATWALTERLGKAWSCYQGAVRVYWPGLSLTDDPFSHPLWTLERILEGTRSLLDASRRLRHQLRRRLLDLSTRAVRPHPVHAENTAAFRRARIAEGERIARETRDHQALAEAYAAENVQLRAELERSETTCLSLEERLVEREKELEERDREIAALRRNVVDLTAYQAARADRGIAPATEAPPRTMAEAIEIARVRFAGRVRFGADVDRGVAELNPTEAQPEKILDYLAGLARLVDARRAGDLGKTIVEWLNDHGLHASQESDTVRRNHREQLKRRFDACGAPRIFDLHLKPKNGTSPDRCVRIYFDWDEASRSAVVGWVGRHL